MPRHLPLKAAPPTAAQVERRRLVEAPFPTIRTIPSQKSWTGCWVQDQEAYFHSLFRRHGQDYSDSGNDY